MPLWLLLFLAATLLLVIAYYAPALPPEIRQFVKLAGILVLVAAVFFLCWSLWELFSAGAIHP